MNDLILPSDTLNLGTPVASITKDRHPDIGEEGLTGCILGQQGSGKTYAATDLFLNQNITNSRRAIILTKTPNQQIYQPLHEAPPESNVSINPTRKQVLEWNGRLSEPRPIPPNPSIVKIHGEIDGYNDALGSIDEQLESGELDENEHKEMKGVIRRKIIGLKVQEIRENANRKTYLEQAATSLDDLMIEKEDKALIILDDHPIPDRDYGQRTRPRGIELICSFQNWSKHDEYPKSFRNQVNFMMIFNGGLPPSKDARRHIHDQLLNSDEENYPFGWFIEACHAITAHKSSRFFISLHKNADTGLNLRIGLNACHAFTIHTPPEDIATYIKLAFPHPQTSDLKATHILNTIIKALHKIQNKKQITTHPPPSNYMHTPKKPRFTFSETSYPCAQSSSSPSLSLLNPYSRSCIDMPYESDEDLE